METFMAIMPIVICLSLILIIALCLVSFIKVGPDEFMVVEWKFFLCPRPGGGHFIATGYQQGIRARVYGPGWNFIPFVTRPSFATTTTYKLFEVLPGQRGLVEALDGKIPEQDEIVASKAISLEDLLDGEAFLKKGGQRGWQIPMLPPGKYLLNPRLYNTEFVTPTSISSIDVNGVTTPQLGMVIMRIGKTPTEGKVLAEKPRPQNGYTTHNNFQDIHAFLEMEGEKGLQSEMLEPGDYILNPKAVSVTLIKASLIKEGEIGVIISSVGEEPTSDMVVSVDIKTADHRQNTTGTISNTIPDLDPLSGVWILKPGVVNKRGVSSEILRPGFHYIHPVAQKVIPVDTTPIKIYWNRDDKLKPFDAVPVFTREPYTFEIEIEVGYQIKPEDTPKFIAVSKSVAEFNEDTIDTQLKDIIQTIVSKKSIIDFLENREVIRDEIHNDLADHLKNYFVNLLSFRISNILYDKDKALTAYINLRTQEINVQRQQAVIETQIKIATTQIELAKKQAEANQQPTLVAAQLGVEMAELSKKAILIRASALAEILPSIAGQPPFVQAMAIFAVDPDLIQKPINAFAQAIASRSEVKNP